MDRRKQETLASGFSSQNRSQRANLTYGYDAYTRGREQLTKQSIYDHAVTLLSHLAMKRQLTEVSYDKSHQRLRF
jgi:hypothetical protein